jgi:hypothetical protein
VRKDDADDAAVDIGVMGQHGGTQQRIAVEVLDHGR